MNQEYLNRSYPVLDHGFVRCEQSNLSDEMVVRAARVSIDPDDPEITDEKVRRLIPFLMRERHGSPFEHGSITFHVKAPIFVFREWHRHRIASINEWSGRYSELKDEWYVPQPEDVRVQVGKPGHYSFDPVTDAEAVKEYQDEVNRVCSESFHVYHDLLEAGFAKEIARIVLPVNTYSQMYWTVNARALMNFLSLRNSGQAQREIRYYAQAIERLWAELMPVTHRAFVENDRHAP